MEEIDFDRAEYVTNRELENDEGESTGHLKMFSYDCETFHFQIVCPYCEHEHEGSEDLGQRPWWIECPECGRSTNVYRIKDKKKREIKDRAPDPSDVT